MYFCKNCGRLAHPGEDRCPKCGAAHIQPAPAATAPTGPAAPQYHPAEDAPEQDVPALGFGSTLSTQVSGIPARTIFLFISNVKKEKA